MFHVIAVLSAFICIAVLSKYTPNVKAFFFRMTGSSITAEELKLLKKSRLRETDFYIALDLIESCELKVTREEVMKRALSGKPYLPLIKETVKLQNCIRDFSWRFICDIEDSSVEVSALTDLFYHAERRRESPDSVPEESYAVIAYWGIVKMFSSDYENARIFLKKSLELSFEEEIQFCLAETFFWEYEAELRSSVVKRAFDILEENSPHISRMADMFLDQFEHNHPIDKEIVLSDFEKETAEYILTRIDKAVSFMSDHRERAFLLEIKGAYCHQLGQLSAAVDCLKEAAAANPAGFQSEKELKIIEEKILRENS